MTLPTHIAMVADGVRIPLPELMIVAAAIQKQVVRDFAPLWGVTGTVAAFANLKDVPGDYLPVTIKDKLDDPDAGGYHSDENGQPFSVVLYDKGWTVSASHEVLEMLADPYGNRMVSGWAAGERVNFLVEACDPCESDDCTYTVNGIKVSDFVVPQYFDPIKVPGLRYCYSGRLDGPRELHRDGYLSWMTGGGNWFQRTWFNGTAPIIESMGKLDIKNGNLRSAIDVATRARRRAAQ